MKYVMSLAIVVNCLPIWEMKISTMFENFGFER
jgi:hypothetical protein